MSTDATYEHLRRTHPAAVAAWAARHHQMLTADDRDVLLRLHLEHRIGEAVALLARLATEAQRLRGLSRPAGNQLLAAEMTQARVTDELDALHADLARLKALESADV
jgi:hypothetical protein